MIDMNELQRLLDFADRQHIFDMYKATGNTGFQPTQFNVPKMKMDWAMSMLGGGPNGGPNGGSSERMPDYFGGLQGSQGSPGSQVGQGSAMNSPAYVPPVKFDGQMPQLPQNYLANFLKQGR